MKKTFWNYEIEFKDIITMKTFQAISIALKWYQEKQDEVWLAFTLFPLVCEKINGEEKTEEQKKEWIEWLTDFQIFNDICSTIGELQTKYMWWMDEKKKIQ